MANEKRNFIDRDDIIDSLGASDMEIFAKEVIGDAPTVDAVEVVRCKDCQQFEPTCPGYGYCYHWDYEPGMSPNEVEDDDFCSYGKRREDNG